MALELEFKAEVVDRNGKSLGTVDHYVRDAWSGEISKFVVRREAPKSDLFLSPQDVSSSSKEKVNLNVTLEELEKR
jgi:sporulation protein YlmC with PRC-barrel domain